MILRSLAYATLFTLSLFCGVQAMNTAVRVSEASKQSLRNDPAFKGKLQDVNLTEITSITKGNDSYPSYEAPLETGHISVAYNKNEFHCWKISYLDGNRHGRWLVGAKNGIYFAVLQELYNINQNPELIKKNKSAYASHALSSRFRSQE